MKKVIYALLPAVLGITACNDNNYDDVLNEIVSADQIDIEVFTDTPGSNMVIVKNNTKGVIPQWNTSMGSSHRQCDTIIAPFLGEFTVEFTGWAGGGPTETVKRSVNIEKMVYATDEWYAILAGEGEKKWVWDPKPGRGVSGPYGSGGYGYSPDVPNWGDIQIGTDPVYADEYLVFDLKGGANVTYHKHDGTEEKGSFSFKKGVDSARGALTPSFRNGEATGTGWVGTLTISGCGIPAHMLQWGAGTPGETYEIAVLSPDEMVLIQNMYDAELNKDWGGSTHWCFVREGVK